MRGVSELKDVSEKIRRPREDLKKQTKKFLDELDVTARGKKSELETKTKEEKKRTVMVSPPVTTGTPVATKEAPKITTIPQQNLKKKKANERGETTEDEWEDLRPLEKTLLAEQIKTSVNVEQDEVFRRRCVKGPFAAVAKGQFLTTLKMKETDMDDMAQHSLAVSTVKAHKRLLRFLMLLPEKYRQLNLDQAMVQYFLDLKVSRKWLASTMVVKMATAHGALRLLPLYVEGELPVMMKESVTWMSAMKAAGRLAKQTPPHQPQAATWEQVKTAIDKEKDTAIRMALLLTWLTCGRGRDVLLLSPKHVELIVRQEKTKKGKPEKVPVMSVGFYRGKTVKTRGPYTVFTRQPPQEFQDEFSKFLKEADGRKLLFPGVKGAKIKDALRRADKKLEQRSLRRGAIQALAKSGVSETELLHFSGHTNVTMLRRYLNFGKVSAEGTRLAKEAMVLAH